MMTHNTRPIQGSVCSKDMAVDPCVSKTKGSAFGTQGLRLAASTVSSRPHCFHVCYVNRGNGIKRDGEDGRNKHADLGKCHIAVSALQTQLTALPVSAEEKVS